MFFINLRQKRSTLLVLAGFFESMKRLTYISSFSRPLNRAEIEQIEQVSVRNNSREGLTGALFAFKDVFYQVIEGQEKAIEQCYARILADDRHKDIFCLKTETDVTQRLYGDWAMKTVVLEESGEAILVALRNMMDGLSSTHRILEKYAPAKIIQTIQEGRNPAAMKSIMADRAVLFADILASTTLTEAFSPDSVAGMLGDFYEIANGEIAQKGGTISKLTGDGLMAYFDSHNADAALDASIQIVKRLKALRESAKPGSPLSLLYTGIGISAGPVLEGSVGSEERKDYTLLGDAVNSAARLESVTRKTGTAIVFDARLKNALKHDRPLKRLGKYLPKGKTDALEIFTIPDEELKFKITPDALKKRIAETGTAAK